MRLRSILTQAIAMGCVAIVSGCLDHAVPEFYDLKLSPGQNEYAKIELPKGQRVELALTLRSTDDSGPIRPPTITITNDASAATFDLQPSSSDIRGNLLNAAYSIDEHLLRQRWKQFDGRVAFGLPHVAALIVQDARLCVWPNKADFQYNKTHGLPKITVRKTE